MLDAKPFSFGKLNGTAYDFLVAGDVLPMHQHTENDVHISIVARGSFKARGYTWELTVKAGDVLDWKPNDPHEFIALEDNSRLVNIIKG